MNRRRLAYAVVTPARDEAENLARLAECLTLQTLQPAAWIVVDDGSTDSTAALVDSYARSHSWIRLLRASRSEASIERGAPIVRAFHEGVSSLSGARPDIVVKLDADLSFAPTYFERLADRFADDPELGIASGSCFERVASGEWRQRFGTGTGVWGACRAYRSECLFEVLPLEEREGWDEIDALKAVVRGWKTGSFADLPFYHHRREGEREGSRLRVWVAQGEVAHFMAYRPSYVVLRALFRFKSEPAALALIAGYLGAALSRRRRLDDRAAVAYLRRSQRLRNLRRRAREARGLQAVARSPGLAD